MAVAWILVFAVPAQAQLLGRASSAVRGSDDDDDDDSSSGQRDYDYGSDDDDDDDHGSGGLLDSASDAVRGSSSGSSGSRSAHPYGGLGFVARSIGGPLGQPYCDVSSEAPPPDGRPIDARVAVRLELEAGYALGGAGRTGVSARLQLPFLVDLATRYSVFVEPTESGVVVAALGRIGGELRVVDGRFFQLRVGGGLRHFHDDYGSVIGGDFVIGFDAFPGEPIVLSGELSAGVVGEALVVQARGRLGVLVDSTEIYAGYDYEALFAGGIQVDLGGPMLGVRAWL